jgi:ADP-heptose:LPS heptosyltransferase
MRTESMPAPETPPRRPRLTATVERVLRIIGTGAARMAAEPLPSVPRRLLIAKVHGMGDSVLIRLIVEQLRKRNPEMHIGVLAGPATREILTMGTGFRVHSYSQKELSTRSAFGALRDILLAGYDAVLNFEQGSLAGTAFIGCARIPIHAGFVTLENRAKSFFLTHGVCFEESRSMWQHFVALARIVDPGVTEAAEGIAIAPWPATEAWLDGWWRAKIGDRAENTVAFHLGCGPGMDFKRWPIANWVALAKQISLTAGQVTIILTGTALEQPLISQFTLAYRGRVVDGSDAGSIERTAAILRRSRLLVSIDTGVMHLGAALGVPAVGIFGPTSPRHWAPIGPHATYVYDTTAACSPCVNNYRNRMPSHCANADQNRCMRDISPESVMAAARTVVPAGFLG